MIKNFFKFKNKKHAFNKGMTYVELIVVLAIFGTMSSILLFRYGDFDKQISLQNTAQDIAIQIITAQKSAISGKIPNVGEAGSTIINNPVNPSYDPTLPPWKPAYGMFFNVSDPSNFVYIIDGYNDYSFNFFDINDPTKVIKKIPIDKNNKILSICTFEDQNSPSDCTSNTLNIFFKRPNTNAIIYDDQNFIKDKAEITISDTEGRLKKVINIYSSGKVEII
jgi:prepilin-type N-terminal cleavage/methylation domain-containing protein